MITVQKRPMLNRVASGVLLETLPQGNPHLSKIDVPSLGNVGILKVKNA
ncbi:hypothetical protein [Yersinia mollaretii]|nr:hypothetical protein [Yersinia mollaretii]